MRHAVGTRSCLGRNSRNIISACIAVRSTVLANMCREKKTAHAPTVYRHIALAGTNPCGVWSLSWWLEHLYTLYCTRMFVPCQEKFLRTCVRRFRHHNILWFSYQTTRRPQAAFPRSPAATLGGDGRGDRRAQRQRTATHLGGCTVSLCPPRLGATRTAAQSVRRVGSRLPQ